MKRIGIGLIRLYRVVFIWLPSSCRFEPSCSRYTEQAVAVSLWDIQGLSGRGGP